MEMLGFTLGILILAAVAVGTIVSRRRQTRKLRQLAQKRRLNYSAEDLIGIHERYQNLELIRRGHIRHASHVLFGSTDVGMVTLFCYTFDLGFGINRSAQQWSMAIIETTGHYDHWRARPVKSGQTNEDAKTIDRFSISADHQDTAAQLTDADIEQLLQESPAEYHWEVCGPLVAVAVADDSNPETLDELLNTAIKLAKTLAQKSPNNNQ